MEKLQEKIGHLVADDPKLNATLFKLGIHFYNYSEETLAQVCQVKGLSPELVIKRLNEAVENKKEDEVDLSIFPVELVMEYLKHMHYIFIKERIPYLLDLINNPVLPDTPLVDDLKRVFPEFVKEFIQHIYDEEDSLFAYIYLLNRGLRKDADLETIRKYMEDYPMGKFEEEHRKEAEELQGIKELTNNFQNEFNDNVHVKVLMESLNSFNEELKNHALIENEILFPKGKVLESQVAALFPSKNLGDTISKS